MDFSKQAALCENNFEIVGIILRIISRFKNNSGKRIGRLKSTIDLSLVVRGFQLSITRLQL